MRKTGRVGKAKAARDGVVLYASTGLEVVPCGLWTLEQRRPTGSPHAVNSRPPPLTPVTSVTSSRANHDQDPGSLGIDWDLYILFLFFKKSRGRYLNWPFLYSLTWLILLFLQFDVSIARGRNLTRFSLVGPPPHANQRLVNVLLDDMEPTWRIKQKASVTLQDPSCCVLQAAWRAAHYHATTVTLFFF